MTKLYLFCKKIHRIFVIIISVFTIIMAGTGLMLKYTIFSRKYLGFIDLGQVRYLHNNLSVLFTLALGVMIVTGIVMYIYPVYIKRKNAKNKIEPSLNIGIDSKIEN